MSVERFPTEDQFITAVTVRDGNAAVLAGRVLVAKERGIVVRFETDGEPLPSRGNGITLIFGGGDRVFRLKTSIAEVIDGAKLLLEPLGPVTEGERREFLRSDVEVDIRSEAVGPDYVLPGESSAGEPKPDWERQIADLSGSGVGFLSDGLYRKGDLVYVQMVLPTQVPSTVNAIAEVVRAFLDVDSGRQRLAVHFTALDERDRDVLINFVFRKHYEQLGSRIGAVIDPDV